MTTTNLIGQRRKWWLADDAANSFGLWPRSLWIISRDADDGGWRISVFRRVPRIRTRRNWVVGYFDFL